MDIDILGIIEMKILVDDIKADGLDLDEQVSAESIGFENPFQFSFLTPLDITARVEKVDDLVIARVAVKAKFKSFCARCIEDLEGDLKNNFIFDYPYEGPDQVVDVGEDLRQELVILMPPHLLCKEDCKGLCLGCGVNLNKEKCTCKNKGEAKSL